MRRLVIIIVLVLASVSIEANDDAVVRPIENDLTLDAIIVKNEMNPSAAVVRENDSDNVSSLAAGSGENTNQNIILDVPANDDCANAEQISGFGTFPYDTDEASFDGTSLCGLLGQPNVWFLYTATITGSIQFWASQDDVDDYIKSVLVAFDGSDCPVDDLPDTLELAGGETIETAVAINSLPTIITGVTTDYDHDYTFSEECIYYNGNYPPDVVYSYTATFDGVINITLKDASPDLSSNIFNTALIIVDEDGTELACRDNGYFLSTMESAIFNFPVTTGETYYIIVTGGYYYEPLQDNGDYVLTIDAPSYGYQLLDFSQRYYQGAFITIDVVQGQQYLIEVTGRVDRTSHTNGPGVLYVWETPDIPEYDDCEYALDAGLIEVGVPVEVSGVTNTGATFDCNDHHNTPEVWTKFTIDKTLNIDIGFCGSGNPPDTVFHAAYIHLDRDCSCSDDVIVADNYDGGMMCDEPEGWADWLIEFDDLPAGTYYYPVSSYLGNMGGFVLTFSASEPQTCDDNVLFGQSPSEETDSWVFWPSDNNANVVCSDKFYGVSDRFNKITWWGTMANADYTIPCEADIYKFDFTICDYNEDNTYIPGDTIATFTDVIADKYLTGNVFNEFDEYRFEATLNTSIDMELGWVIISGANGDDDCQFLWQDALTGSCALYNRSSREWSTDEYDLAFCVSYDTLVSINDDIIVELPEQVSLSQNYPNPFNATTSIQFYLNKADDVKLSIYDIGGRLIKSLYNGTLPSGSHNITWDGTNDSGEAVSSGIYFYRLTNSESSFCNRMVLLK